MMLKRIADFLLAKRGRTALVIFALNIYPVFLPTLAIIAFAFIVLKKGIKAGCFLLPWALLPYLAHAVVWQSATFFVYPAAEWCLMLLIVSLLVRYHSWTLIVQCLSLIGILFVLLFHAYVGDTVAWWHAHFQQYVTNAVGTEVDNVSDYLNNPNMQLLLKITTGLQVTMFAFFLAFKLVIARWWQAVVDNPGGLKKELHQIRMAGWMFTLLVIAAVGVAMKQDIAFDASIPLLGAYVVAGFSLLHAWVVDYNFGFVLLMLCYLAVVLMPYLLLGVVLVAIFDSWIHFRARKTQKD